MIAGALRTLRSVHEHPAIVSWWARRLEHLGAAAVPRWRRRALSAVSAVLLVGAVGRRPWVTGTRLALGAPLQWALGVPCVVALLALVWLAATRFERLPRPIRRRPQVALHAVFWGLLVLLWLTPDAGGTWRRLVAFVAVLLPKLLWRCGYLFKTAQRGKIRGTDPGDHLFYLWPLWRGTATPYGKGFDYLAQHEARSAEAWARSQLAGVKLLVLAQIWRGVMLAMAALVYGEPGPLHRLLGGWSLGVPRLDRLLLGTATASPLLGLTSLWLDLVWRTLKLAVKGHNIVGVLRLCGYRVFRNTYKPLLAESVLEFWNRYYWYFKELLVEFFFYPTFARSRGPVWLRTGLAVFTAAFAGNMYYHLIQESTLLVRGDAGKLWLLLHARLVYCLLLATGIWISMLRERNRRGRADRTGVPRRLLRIAGVWAFYVLIHVWGAPVAATFAQRNRFLFSLFGA